MTREQLKHLALLPKVIEALRVLAAETEEAHRLMQRVGMAMPAAQPIHHITSFGPPVASIPPPAPNETQGLPGPVVLMTAERQEYLASLKKDRDTGLESAARQMGQLPPKPVEQLPAAQRKAIQQGYMAGVQAERDAKMAQFTYDGTDETLSEAT